MSDINTLQQFDDDEEIPLGNFDKQTSTAPPPVPAGDYKLKYELGNVDIDKAIKRSQSPKYNGGKTFISVSLIGTIVESLNEDIPTEDVFNRRVYTFENTGVQRAGDASRFSDWAKSVGLTDEDIPKRFSEFKPWLVEFLATSPTGNVRIDWQASGKDDAAEDPKAKYVQPKQYNSMTKFPQDSEGNYLSEIEGYEVKATGSIITLTARNEIKNYYPAD